MFLNCLIFFYKYYFNIFPNRKYLEKESNVVLSPDQTLSMERIAKAGHI
jgi:hypothetical protein